MDVSVKQIIVAIVILLASWLVIFFSAITIIEPSFTVLFMAYGFFVGGLFLGFKGVFEYTRGPKKKEKEEEQDEFKEWYR